jgi:hypothetical protein
MEDIDEVLEQGSTDWSQEILLYWNKRTLLKATTI